MTKFAVLTALAILCADLASSQITVPVPGDAIPQGCLAQVAVPAVFATVTEQMEKRQATQDIVSIPATFESVEEQHLIRQETTRLTVVPAVYETVSEVIEVRPEYEEIVAIPGVYESFEKDVLIRDAHTVWLRETGSCDGDNSVTEAAANRDVFCKIDVPAEYQTVRRLRLRSDPAISRRTVPAVTKTITKQVLIEPARVIEETVPGEYETVIGRKLKAPARHEFRESPGSSVTIEKHVLTADGGLKWREVVCATGITPGLIDMIQTALTDLGYSVPTDRKLGRETWTAIEAYQRDEGLPIGGLTVMTLESLGVSPP